MSAYYVSPSGSDSNTGSQSAPFATIQRGVDAAQPGDAVVVMAGIYVPAPGSFYVVTIDKAGTQNAPITIMGQGAVLDGQGNCHSWFNLGASAAWIIIQDFEILNSNSGGVWSNSGGGRNIVVRGNHIHNIGNRYDPSTIGIAGIYADGGAQNFRVEGNAIHSIGRTNDAGSPYDHGIYSHGNLQIVGNSFADARTGWHIQTADGFSGAIQGNTFQGPNQYPGKGGQVMLWGSDGEIDISGNDFIDPQGPAVVYFGFSSPRVTMGGNTVSGSGSAGGPPGVIPTDAALISPVVPAEVAPIALTAPTAFLGPPLQAPQESALSPIMLAAGAALALWLLSD